MKTNGVLLLPVTFDDEKTDLESLSSGVDTLLRTATSPPGILDDYGEVTIGDTELPAEPKSAWVEEHIRALPLTARNYVRALERKLGIE